MTEIGRRAALFIGTLAFASTVFAGTIWFGGNPVTVCLFGLGAGLIFGTGGMLIGNLIEGYIVQEARREQARQAIERLMAKEARKTEKAETYEEAAT